MAHCLICMVIIHSDFNDPPLLPQLNDYSFIYFHLFTSTLLIIAALSGITGGGEGVAEGILMISEETRCLNL